MVSLKLGNTTQLCLNIHKVPLTEMHIIKKEVQTLFVPFFIIFFIIEHEYLHNETDD